MMLQVILGIGIPIFYIVMGTLTAVALHHVFMVTEGRIPGDGELGCFFSGLFWPVGIAFVIYVAADKGYLKERRSIKRRRDDTLDQREADLDRRQREIGLDERERRINNARLVEDALANDDRQKTVEQLMKEMGMRPRAIEGKVL
jgi:hypothetical protein